MAFSLAFGFVLPLLSLSIAYFLWRKVGGSVRVPRRLALAVVLAGVVAGVISV